MNKPLQYFGAAALALGVAGSAQATSLLDLFAGGSITAGDKVFDQWKIIFQDTSLGVAAPDAGGIDVTALDDGGDDLGPGINIDFGDEMTVGGDGSFAYSDLTISFRVSPTGDKKIKGNSLTFGDPPSDLTWTVDSSKDLGIFIEEWVYADAALGLELGHTSIHFSVLDDVETRDWPGLTAFTPQDEIWVVKNFLVWSVDDTDTASLGGVEQRFSQTTVPEPSTLLLFALGLAGVGFASRRRD